MSGYSPDTGARALRVRHIRRSVSPWIWSTAENRAHSWDEIIWLFGATPWLLDLRENKDLFRVARLLSTYLPRAHWHSETLCQCHQVLRHRDGSDPRLVIQRCCDRHWHHQTPLTVLTVSLYPEMFDSS
jgi:hypothetical protein